MVNLKEYIHPEMDILFLALNAPQISNANAHWFSNNLSFWNVLYNAGLISQAIFDCVEGDEKVFGSNKINFQNYTYGVTDLNNEVVETNSNKVIIEKRHLERIKKILENHKVARLCLMHSTVGKAFRNSGLLINTTSARYGLIGYISETAVYEVPFHNASVPEKVQYYELLIYGEVLKENSKILKTPMLQEKLPAVKANDIITSYFILPSEGNSITKADLEKGTLRITADFKDKFPKSNSSVKINYCQKSKDVQYEIKPGKSSLLKIGKDVVADLGLRPNCHIRFEKVGEEFCFKIILK